MSEASEEDLLTQEELEALFVYYVTGDSRHLEAVGMERVYDLSELVEEDGTFELPVVSFGKVEEA